MFKDKMLKNIQGKNSSKREGGGNLKPSLLTFASTG
jgi:hypothetical protein